MAVTLKDQQDAVNEVLAEEGKPTIDFSKPKEQEHTLSIEDQRDAVRQAQEELRQEEAKKAAIQAEQNRPKSFLENATNMLRDTAQNINNLGGGFGRGAVNAAINTYNFVTPNSMHAQPIQKYGFENPNSDLSEIGTYPGAAAGYMAANEALGPLKYFGLVGNILRGGLAAAATSNPEDRANNALIGATLSGALQGVTGIYKAAKFLRGDHYQQPADELINSITNKQDINSFNKHIADNVKNTYEDIKNPISNGYEKLINDSKARGYTENSDNQVKKIILSPDNINHIENIYSKNGISEDLKNVMLNFTKNPTLENAHNMQSRIGKEWADLNSNLGRSQEQQDALNFLNNSGIRNNITKDIQDSLSRNGDRDLAQKYNELTQQWRENVVPFHESPGIWKWVRQGGKIPKNVSEILSNDDSAGNLEKVRDLIKQNDPDLANKIGMQSLLKGAGSGENSVALRTMSGDYTTDVKKLGQRLYNMSENSRQMISPEIQNKLEELIRLRAHRDKWLLRKNTTTKYAKKLGIGALIGLPIYGGGSYLSNKVSSLSDLVDDYTNRNQN